MAAKEIVIKITADTTTAVSSLGQLTAAIDKMETNLTELQDKLTQEKFGTENFKKLQAEIKRTQAEIEKAKGSFDKAAGSTTKFSEKALAMGDNIEKVGMGIGAAFGLATGVIGAFGDSLGFSAEEVQAAQEKAQSFILILTSLKPVIEGAKAGMAAFNAVAAANPISLIVLAIGALVVAFIAFRKPIIEFISNWENLRLVLLAMLGPIGWIIIAYEKLFSKEAELENEREKQAAAQRKRNAEIGAENKKRLQEIAERGAAERAAIDEKQSALKLEIDTLEAQGKSSDEATVAFLEGELEKTKSVLKENEARIASWVTYYETLAAAQGKSQEQFKAEMKAQGVDLDAALEAAKKTNVELMQNVQYAENQITKFNREASEERAENSKEAAAARLDAENRNRLALAELAVASAMTFEAEKKAEIEFLKVQNDIALQDEELTAGEILLLNQQLANDIAAINIEIFEDAEATNQKIIDDEKIKNDKIIAENKRREQALEDYEAFALEISGDAQEAEFKRYSDQFDTLKAFYDQGIISREEFEAQADLIAADHAEKRKEIDRAEFQAKVDNAMEYTDAAMNALSSLNGFANQLADNEIAKIEQKAEKDLKLAGLTEMQKYNIKKKAAEETDKINKKKFQRDKALSLAEAAIATALGVVKSIPNIPLMILSGVAGAAGIAAIAATKFEGTADSIAPPDLSGATASAASSLGGSSATQTNTPSFNLFGGGNNLNNLGPGQNNNQQSGPTLIKAYVSETDLINTQDRLQLIKSEL